MTKINDFLNEVDFYLSTLESNKKSKASIKIAEDIRVIINNNQDLLLNDYYNEKPSNPDFDLLQRKFDNAIQKLNEADDQISSLQIEKQQLMLSNEIAHTSIAKFENTTIVNRNLIDELERLLDKSKQENNEKEVIIKELRSDKKPTELLKKMEDDNMNLKLKCAEYEKLFTDYQLHIIELENRIHTLSTSPPKQYSTKNPLAFDSGNTQTLHDEIMFINQQEEFHKVKKEYKELYDYNRRLKIEVSNLRDELERVYYNQHNDDLCCCTGKSCTIS